MDSPDAKRAIHADGLVGLKGTARGNASSTRRYYIVYTLAHVARLIKKLHTDSAKLDSSQANARDAAAAAMTRVLGSTRIS